MTKGLFISFEGPDGAGKTSVLNQVVSRLKNTTERTIISTREPGGVAIAEKIRSIILDIDHETMDAKTELLLYIAARRQHYVERILPHLEAGNLVLVDRFIDSSLAYQGYGRGLDLTAIDWLNQYATEGRKPDLTLYFDVPTAIGLNRIYQSQTREINRLDLEVTELHQAVRCGYLALVQKEPDRFYRIDASKPLADVVEIAVNRVLAAYGEHYHD